MLGGVYYSSCQLNSRHWTIRSRDRVVSDVRGEGVIGQVWRNQEKQIYIIYCWMLRYIRKIKIAYPSNGLVLCSILCCHQVRMSLSTRAAHHWLKGLELWRALFCLCLASMFWFCSNVMFDYMVLPFLIGWRSIMIRRPHNIHHLTICFLLQGWAGLKGSRSRSWWLRSLWRCLSTSSKDCWEK